MVNRRERQVQLGAGFPSGQRHADGMKERLALHPGHLARLGGGRAEGLARQRAGVGYRVSKRPHDPDAVGLRLHQPQPLFQDVRQGATMVKLARVLLIPIVTAVVVVPVHGKIL